MDGAEVGRHAGHLRDQLESELVSKSHLGGRKTRQTSGLRGFGSQIQSGSKTLVLVPPAYVAITQQFPNTPNSLACPSIVTLLQGLACPSFSLHHTHPTTFKAQFKISRLPQRLLYFGKYLFFWLNHRERDFIITASLKQSSQACHLLSIALPISSQLSQFLSSLNTYQSHIPGSDFLV